MSQIEWLQQRLQQDRALFREVLDSVLSEKQLDAEPSCLLGLSIREAMISWGAGFSPLDKAPHRVSKSPLYTLQPRITE